MSELPPPSRMQAARAWRDGVTSDAERAVAEETPIALTYDGATHAVMMATPADLEDFAIGFSLTEGLITRASDITDFAIAPVEHGIDVRLWLTPFAGIAIATRRRRLLGASGCGMCGLESLVEANRSIPVVWAEPRLDVATIAAALALLPAAQRLNAVTRAVHAAAYFQPGAALLLREDVGRHNALDKLAGALARVGRDAANGVLLLSSRISVEMVQKAAMIGAPIIVAVSAPTALAVRVAEAARITLVGIARDDGFEIFTHAERIITRDAAHVE
ncbi:MAG: formate dehydrogenase accessory sulfurtransferase FdhD [Acetobacteraceae bacterium]|nr:formate dehydrogenase accessory sulfurtransferase FdhD [Acetobacteraceae bacterium]